MANVLIVAYLLIVLALIAVILLQRSEGGGLAGEEAAPGAPVEAVFFREAGFEGDEGGEIVRPGGSDPGGGHRRTMSSRWMMAGRPL